jgi:hypothetical protein
MYSILLLPFVKVFLPLFLASPHHCDGYAPADMRAFWAAMRLALASRFASIRCLACSARSFSPWPCDLRVASERRRNAAKQARNQSAPSRRDAVATLTQRDPPCTGRDRGVLAHRARRRARHAQYRAARHGQPKRAVPFALRTLDCVPKNHVLQHGGQSRHDVSGTRRHTRAERQRQMGEVTLTHLVGKQRHCCEWASERGAVNVRRQPHPCLVGIDHA